MPWIAHLMVLDDDTRVLDSLVPGLPHELTRQAARRPDLVTALCGSAPDASGRLNVKVTAHGFECPRLKTYRHRDPVAIHLHLVREAGGRFDEARRLLNDQLFGVVVSDQRFSDDAPGQRAGQLFIGEIQRVHPEIQGLLYSAYPRPDDFPAANYLRKDGDQRDQKGLAEQIVAALERYLQSPAVGHFVNELNSQGLIYQSDAFGHALAQLFALARLLPAAAGGISPSSRRPLPCLLIDGESGTGKRALTALFHAATERRAEPLVIASCNELTNETLLRSILFGHKRGAFTDARDDRQGLVSAAGKGTLLLDDFHRLPTSCSAILHSFIEDGQYSRLGEEEQRRTAQAAAVLTVESIPWAQRRRSGELPLAFLARVERLPLLVPPLRERPQDIAAQSRGIIATLAGELGVDLTLSDEAIEQLQVQPFADSNSRELRNVLEQAAYHHYRETDLLEWAHLEPQLTRYRDLGATSRPRVGGAAAVEKSPAPVTPAPARNQWQRRLRDLAAKLLARGGQHGPEAAEALADRLFDTTFPELWASIDAARTLPDSDQRIPQAVWEDIWRCFAVYWLGGPTPAEKSLGIPANTLRQWINDRESR